MDNFYYKILNYYISKTNDEEFWDNLNKIIREHNNYYKLICLLDKIKLASATFIASIKDLDYSSFNQLRKNIITFPENKIIRVSDIELLVLILWRCQLVYNYEICTSKSIKSESKIDSGTGFGSGFGSGFNDLPDFLKNSLSLIEKDYNPYTKVNNLDNGYYKDIFNNTLGNLTEEDKKIKLFINSFEKSKVTTNNYNNISEFIKNQKGGNLNIDDILSILEIKINKIKTSTHVGTKFISTSLFDAYLGNTTIPYYKNINHYSVCLYTSIKLYLEYLPEYKIRIYGDISIDLKNNTNENLIKLFDLINSNDRIEYYEVEQKFNNLKAINPTGNKHIGLLGALFRFYILLDPNTTVNIMVDADNFPMKTFVDNILTFENDNEEGILIFKPYYYARKNLNDNCIQQILAGMSGFKKKNGFIVNPEIFIKIFKYIDNMFGVFKKDFEDVCDNNRIIKYSTPFTFGFEEQALTNILVPYFLINNIKFTYVPLYFDFGVGFNFYYNEILNCLTEEYKKVIKKKLGIDTDNTASLCFVNPLFGFNIHIGIILVNFVHNLLNTNTNKINDIKVFQDDKIENLKKVLSIKGFYNMYPSFNINMEIDKVNSYIDELTSGTNALPDIKPTNLTKDALKEFGKDTTDFYNSYIDEKSDLEGLLSNDKDKILKVLKSSKLYQKKYLKYKEKYLSSKK